MALLRRRYLPIVALIIAICITAFTYWKLDQFSHESPNYTQIEEGLWLGGLVREPPPGTNSVLNLCESEDSYQVENHRWVPIPDSEPAPSIDWLREQVAFVDSERAKGHTVYIHCRAGISRGGMVTTAYLMQRDRRTRDQALEYVRTKRPGVNPNPAFMKLLIEWEQVIKAKEAFKN